MGKNTQKTGEVGKLGKISGMRGRDLKRRPVSFADFLLNRDAALRGQETETASTSVSDSAGEVGSENTSEMVEKE